MLIDSRHEVFDGKGDAIQLKAKMIAKVHAEYPETEPQACLLQTCYRTHNVQLRTFFRA